MMNFNDIRERFIEFFKGKNHTIVDASPLLLKNDSSLMFMNSGMVAFKDLFLGNKEIQHKRIADFQKCLRVSGKHNDLEDVGKDTYHHTLFEMLGNWSFGDYFKKEAIEWSWEFLTKECNINKEDLYVTIFEGDKKDNLKLDKEAYDIWEGIIPKERILKGNKKDNFWEMGSQGPCGPCSEIHIDIRTNEEKNKINGKDLVNKDHPQVIEIWNLVFMQYNRKANGSLEDLPKKHIDTGMGFERLCTVIQGKKSNYDTDLFTPIISEIENLSKKKYNQGNEKTDVAIRVIADHIKAISFTISEGIIPSNNGEGYVIRRILRRAIRYGYTFLDLEEPFMYKLYPILEKMYGDYYPEFKTQKPLVEKIIKKEEETFLRTLDSGLKRLDFLIENNDIKGDKIFELYDTYGFPFDLTSLILSEKNISIDEVGFNKEMKKQKERSKKFAEIEVNDWVVLDNKNETDFLGYDKIETVSKVLKYREVKQNNKLLYHIVLDKTPFYPEGGGQIGDTGTLEDNNQKINVLDTKKENGSIIHITDNIFKNCSNEIISKVSNERRKLIECNHTSTHLLHYTLRKVFGTHIEQKGSLVSDKYLRFDFSHFEKINSKDLKNIEETINRLISEGIELEEKRNANYNEELENGVIALFGEKYDDKVRSIKFGNSYELCGGTHTKNTKNIRYFKILSESSISSGIRRIEAISSNTGIKFIEEKLTILEKIENEFNNSKNIFNDIIYLKNDNIKMKKDIEIIEKEKIKSLKIELKNSIKKINDINFISKKTNLNGKQIKELCFELGGEINDLVLAIGSDYNEKVNISIYISKNLVSDKNLNANIFLKEISSIIEGKGGGQPFFAVFGGKNTNNINKSLERIEDLL